MDKKEVIEFLKERKEARLAQLAYDNGFTLAEIKEKYNEDAEEIYELDDGDNFLQSVDTVLWVLED